MDGNNRWSKKNHINKYTAYKKGADTLIKLSNFIFENTDAKFISAFALSKHNLQRGRSLINIIKNVLNDFLIQNLDKNNFNFRFKFKGDLSFLSKKICKGINDLEKMNKHSEKQLIIYLNYSGKDDIISAVKSLKNLNRVNDKIIKSALLSSDIPDPDMLIRSGGYNRLSDFFLYQVTFTDFFFTKVLWSDMKKSHIKKFINQFNKIDRKFGT